MRWYESGTGHIRCSICRASLLGGRLRTVQRNRQSPPSGGPCRHTVARLQAGHPSGLQVCQALRLDCNRAFRPDHTCGCWLHCRRRRRIVKRRHAHAPLAGAGNLSELVECVGLHKPAAGLGGYEVSWRDDPPCVLCRHAKNRASLG